MNLKQCLMFSALDSKPYTDVKTILTPDIKQYKMNFISKPLHLIDLLFVDKDIDKTKEDITVHVNKKYTVNAWRKVIDKGLVDKIHPAPNSEFLYFSRIPD